MVPCVGPAVLRHGRLVCHHHSDENDGHFARRRDVGRDQREEWVVTPPTRPVRTAPYRALATWRATGRPRPLMELSGGAWNTPRRADSRARGCGRPDRRKPRMLTETASHTAATATDRALDLPAVRVGAAAELSGPRRHAAVRAVPARGGGRAAGDDLPAACAGVRELPAGSVAAADHSGGDVHRVRVLLVVLHQLGGACAAGSSTGRWSGWGWGRSRSWSRSRATTATCCSTSSPRCSLSGDRAVGERRRGGAGEGCADVDGVPDARRPARRCGPSTGRRSWSR